MSHSVRDASKPTPAPLRHTRRSRLGLLLGLMLMQSGLTLAAIPVSAQELRDAPDSESPLTQPSGEEDAEGQTDPDIPDVVALPAKASAAPVVAAGPAGQYVLEFNRSPVVEDRLRLESIYDEARLWFTRPRSWEPKAVKVLLRFRHSPALYATRSNLTVLVNGTSVGSVPLNRKQGEIGNVVFDIPSHLIQDYNEVVIAALQNNSPTCTQDPFDPSLWSEILPDSKIVFDFQPQPIPLDFKQYPYPVIDTLSLEPNRVAYLKPTMVDTAWLTPVSRLQTALGRIVEYRSLDTRLIQEMDQVEADERLIIVGTPEAQPAIASLNLPLALEEEQILDGEGKPLAPDVGVLMLTTVSENRIPVLIATGNGAEGVAKAVQFLVQTQDREIGTGQAILVNQVAEVESPSPRQWPDYLPDQSSFQLGDLKTLNRQPFEDVTVWGSHAPALQFDFRGLPDDQFQPGSTMLLNYSYGPQINPLTSQVEVQLDGVAIGGERLRSVEGGNRETLRVDLPEDAIKPYSKIQVNFRLDPRERRSCSRVTDQQLWGTIHADTQFDLKREIAAWLPDLKLLQNGFPFAAPQDLSQTAIAVPDEPSDADLLLLLEISERLGRLSKADSVKIDVYRASQVPEDAKRDRHWIGIGAQAQFPFPEVFQDEGFKLSQVFSRQRDQSQIQTLPDEEGLVKQILSPWNRDRVLLALSGQTATGLDQVRSLISQDSLFYQLEGDTVLISANDADPSPFDPNAYNLTVLKQESQQLLAQEDKPQQVFRLIQRNWLFLSAGTVAAALIFYGIVQQYFKRFVKQEPKQF